MTSLCSQTLVFVFVVEQSIVVHVPKGEKQAINNQQEDWKFTFNKVLHNAPQETVFEQCAQDIIDNVLEGYNGTTSLLCQIGS